MAKTNKNSMQVNILMIQEIIVALLTPLYFIMDNAEKNSLWHYMKKTR